MKKIILPIIYLLFSAAGFAQVGLGGVGSSTNLDIWLDASKLTLSNNDPVTSWTDLSGNDNHAEQISVTNQPTFVTNQINGFPAIEFDGTDDYLDFTNNLTTDATTIFTVNLSDGTSLKAVVATEKHSLNTEYFNSTAVYYSPFQKNSISKSQGQYSLYSLQTGSNPTTGSLFLTNGANTKSLTRNSFYNRSFSSVGASYNPTNAGLFQDGQIAEIVIFNEELNSAKRKIVSNFLAAKYDLTPEENLYAYSSTHGTEVIGVGQEADGNHTSSRGIDSLSISNPSSLSDAEYLFVGSDGASFSTSVNTGLLASQRWTRVWRAGVTGSPGTIDLTFYLGSNDFAVDPNDYAILVEDDDGDFTNLGTSIQESGRVYDPINKTVSFTGITLNDGDYFTLAEKASVTPSVVADFPPGGIESTNNVEIWLDASSLTGISDADPVLNWSDISGNDNHAQQANITNQPTYLTNQINGLPALDFDGTDDYLDFVNNITTTATTIFTVNYADGNSLRAVIGTANHSLNTEFFNATAVYYSPFQKYSISKTQSQYSVYSLQTGSNATTDALSVTNAANSKSFTRNAFYNRSFSSIGASYNPTNPGLFQDGQIAEIIMFNEEINSAKRKIVNNYLAAKYNLTAEEDLFSYKSTHGFGVIGIGQESDGSNTIAQGDSVLKISNTTSLDDGDYLLVGNDNSDYSAVTSTPGGISSRYNKVWRAGVTNTPGPIELEFYINGNTLVGDPNNYVVLIDTDGDFSNGGTTQHTNGFQYDAINQTITFTAVSFADGDYFTLAMKDPNISAIASGSWKQPTTWDCSCIPDETSTVIIGNPFEITIDSNARANFLTLENGGEIFFDTDDTLRIENSFDIDGILTMDELGTIRASGSILQEFTNTSGDEVELWNLYVDNTDAGLNITSGAWSIANQLRVSSGGLNVTGTDSVVLKSNVDRTSQIMQSMSGAFAGEFKVERFVSDRQTDYSDVSSPISDGTVADLDDDLYLSGVSGRSGNAQTSGGGVFRSVYRFDRPTDAHVALTSTSDAFEAGQGYEIYLGTTSSVYNEKGWAWEGTPNSGTITPTTIDEGFNLVGNPYHSFIDFDETDKSNINDIYYIYDASISGYQNFFGGSKPAIAPSQGYWVDKPDPGTVSYIFEESDKVDSDASTFVRKKAPDFAEIHLSEDGELRNNVKVRYNVSATGEYDEMDYSFLPSPITSVAQINATAINSNKKLSVTTINNLDDYQVIPLQVDAEIGKDLGVELKNLDNVIDNYSCAYLKNNNSNEVIDLLVENTYNFTSENDKTDLQIVLSNSYEDCQEKLESNTSTNQDLDESFQLRNSNGNWYLNYKLSDENQNLVITVFNINGQQVGNSISFNANGEGNYLLRNLNNVDGIYLIQVKGDKLFLNETIKL